MLNSYANRLKFNDQSYLSRGREETREFMRFENEGMVRNLLVINR